MSINNVMFNDRKLIVNTTENFLDSYNRDRILIYYAYAGAGKTETLLRTLLKRLDIFFTFLGPTHNLVDEICNKHKINHIKGKSLECINIKLSELSSHCNTSYYCTHICPYYSDCEYYHKIRYLFDNPQTWAGVHGHITNIFDDFTKKFDGSIDLNIIDESFFQSMTNRKFIKKEQIKRFMEIATYKPLLRFSEELEYLIKNNDEYDENNIIKIIKNMDGEFLKEESKKVDKKISEMYNSGENINNTFNYTNTFVGLNKYVERKKDPRSFLQFNDNSADIYYHDFINLTGSTILLNATPNMNITKEFFPENTKFDILNMSPIYSLDQTIRQFSGDSKNAYGINTLYRKGHLTTSHDYLCKIVNSISKQFSDKKGLVIARNKHGILDGIKKNIELDNLSYAYFNNLRGLNEFEDCFFVIIFGTSFPNPKQVRRLAEMLGVSYEEIEKNLREDEMLQGVWRIRIFGKECYIFVLSSIKLFEKDANVIYMTPNQMLKYFDKQQGTSNTKYGEIYSQIKEMIKKEEVIKKSELLKRVKGDNNIKNEVLVDLIKEGFAKEDLRRGKRRPMIYIILK